MAHQKNGPSEIVNRKFFFHLFLFLLIPLIFIQFRGLWAPDEARYARVSAEMKRSGNLLVPKLNGGLYAEKPPLFFDLTIAASAFSKDVPEYGVKVVSLFSALLVVILLTKIGMMLGLKDSSLPVVILLAMPRFLWQAQFGQIDMLLCALVYLQLWLGLSLLLDERAGAFKTALLGFSSFLAVIAKGPAGVFPVFIVLIIFAYFVDRRKKLASVLGSLIAALSFVSVWLLTAGLHAGWDYPKSLLFRQTLTRYLDPWHHHAPWYYYPAVLWGDGFPVVLFLIPAVIMIIRRKEFKDRKWLFPLLIIAAWLVFFSASSAKRSVYILPVYPAVALLLSFAFEKWKEGTWDRKGLKIISAVLNLVFTATLVAALATDKIPAEFRTLFIYLLLGIMIFLTFYLLFAVLLIRKDIIALQIIAFASCLFMLSSALPVINAIDPVKAPYALTREMKPRLNDRQKLGVSGSLVPSVNYYLDTDTKVFKEGEEKEAATFIEEGNYLLIQKEDHDKSPLQSFRKIWHGNIGGAEYLVITRNEEAGSSPPPS